MYPYIFTLHIPWIDITLQPRFYGLFYAIAILIGSRIAISEVERRKINLTEDEVMNHVLLIFLGGLLGGRSYEVIFEWSNYYQYQPWTEVFAVWHGGLAIHGGVLGGILAILLYCRWKKLRFAEMADIGAICLIMGQAIGRWGNFTNGETAGPVTDFWTGVVFPANTVVNRYAQGSPVHPTMIYESLGNFIILGILWKLRLKNFRHGMLACLYLIFYSLLRSGLTPLRMDNQFFTLGETQILAPYAISVTLSVCAISLILSLKLWKQQETAPSIISTADKETDDRVSGKKRNKNKKNNKKSS